MSKIGFCRAVTYENHVPRSTSQFLLEKVDNYFYLGGRKAQVIAGSQKNVANVKFVRSSLSKLEVALKIASYCTIILPLLLLVAKSILRLNHRFRLIQANLIPPTPSNLSNPTTQESSNSYHRQASDTSQQIQPQTETEQNNQREPELERQQVAATTIQRLYRSYRARSVLQPQTENANPESHPTRLVPQPPLNSNENENTQLIPCMESTPGQNFFEGLFTNLTTKIFNYLTIREQATLPVVCKQWQKITKNRLDFSKVSFFLTRHPLTFSNQTQPQIRYMPEALEVEMPYVISSFYGGRNHNRWTALYYTGSQQKRIIEQGQANYQNDIACFLNHKLARLSHGNDSLEFNVYDINGLNLEFRSKICDASYQSALIGNLLAPDCNKRYLATSLGASIADIKIYKTNCEQVVSIQNPTPRQMLAYCKGICFSGNRLVAALNVIPINRSSLPADDNKDKPYCIQAYNPETGQTIATQFLDSEPIQIAGNQDHLIVVTKDPNPLHFYRHHLLILNPHSLEERTRLVDNCIQFLQIKDQKVISLFLYDKLKIINALTGQSIFKMENREDWNRVVHADISEKFLVITLRRGSGFEGAIELWDIETRKRIRRVETESVPKIVKFRTDNTQQPYLVAAFSNGEIRAWTR